MDEKGLGSSEVNVKKRKRVSVKEKIKMDEKGRSNNSEVNGKKRKRVGLIYDERMCNHHPPYDYDDDHPECPHRIRVILDKLTKSGLLHRCEILNPKEAKDKCIQLVHSKVHVDLIRTISSKQFDSRRDKIASKFTSIYLNEGSSQAAYLAAGSVLEAAEKVANGDLDSAFAIVRPPGHHAEENEPMGFCLFNNAAIAASYLLNERPELGIHKILIVDWDVHHGNGSQKMFWKDSRVLFFSVHRHDFGKFYPGTKDGSHVMIGEGSGEGYNINVPWEHDQCGDPDYFAVWDHLLIPVAKEYNPDIIIVSAGFDAAAGDPLGGCCVTPYGYSVLLTKLMDFAQGKVVLALEGGYNLQSLANSVHACVQVLLEEKPVCGFSETHAFESTWRIIENVRQNLCKYWPSLSEELPRNIITRKAPQPQLLIDTIPGSETETESLYDDSDKEVACLHGDLGSARLESFGTRKWSSNRELKQLEVSRSPASNKSMASCKTVATEPMPHLSEKEIPFTTDVEAEASGQASKFSRGLASMKELFKSGSNPSPTLIRLADNMYKSLWELITVSSQFEAEASKAASLEREVKRLRSEMQDLKKKLERSKFIGKAQIDAWGKGYDAGYAAALKLNDKVKPNFD